MRILILLAVLGCALAVNPTDGMTRIVGGSPTTIQTYPYMVNMQYAFLGIFWLQRCGGSLLTSNAILSAAHCFDGDHPNEWRAVLGSSLAQSGGTVHPLLRIVMHPQYNNLNHDVAVLRLRNNAVFSDSIQPARLAGTTYNLADNTVVTHIGWGVLWSDGPSSDQLMHVNVNIINQQLCAERYAYLKTDPNFEHWPDITSGMLCAGILNVGGKDACQGDSGGPLAHNRDVIVGVTSWGRSCADPFYPGVNARVSYYSNWITANANSPL